MYVPIPSIKDMLENDSVALLKLADRLDNTRGLGSMSRDHQVRRSLENLIIYAPSADRLGLIEEADELRKRAYSCLYDEFDSITESWIHLILGFMEERKGSV